MMHVLEQEESGDNISTADSTLKRHEAISHDIKSRVKSIVKNIQCCEHSSKYVKILELWKKVININIFSFRKIDLMLYSLYVNNLRTNNITGLSL